MSGDWVSIWALAQEQWPQKPRFYASRLLNYSILHDIPRKVGDVIGAIGGDTERLYNISVNSPNVDRISREVFLSLPLVKSHLESRRFNPEERYLPRRPRQEEYLISKPATPFTLLPVGEEGEGAGGDERLSYFARMGIPYGVTRRKRQPVALDYRQNLLLDREMPPIREVARKRYPEDAVELPEGAEPPSRLGCINSEEALLWNVFRTLIRENGMKHFLSAPILNNGLQPVASDERVSAAWFWGMNDRGSTFLPLVHASEALGEPIEKHTIPDLVLLGINHFLLIEARYGSTFSSCPMLKHDQCPGTGGCYYWNEQTGVPKELPQFVERQDVTRTCGRHFQLMRLFLLVKQMSQMPSMGEGRLVAIIDENQEAGQINRKLFTDFVRNLEPDDQKRVVLTSWQRVRAMIPNEAKFEELHRELREKWAI